MPRQKLKSLPDRGSIRIRGARQNNLKGIDLDLPLGKLNVISGPSGSGKSSLAFDTIYAEGQRRYVETFSPYTRQFLERMDKPQVDEIRGIPPTIAIEQSNPVRTTRSTVGTMTEINDYLKVLMPRVAQANCPECAREIRPETPTSILDHALQEFPGDTVFVTFPVVVPPKTAPVDFFQFLQQQGYLRVWVDGKVCRTDEPSEVTRLPALVQVIQDRITLNPANRSRISEAIETALKFGKGRTNILHSPKNVFLPFSTGWHCAHCDIDVTPPSAGLFSFNNPVGACPRCRGFGRTIGIDLKRAIPDPSVSIADGAVKPFHGERGAECQRDLLRAAGSRDLDIHTPFEDLPKADQDFVLFGEDPTASAEELWENGRWYGVRGFFDWLESKAYKMHVRVFLSRYRSYTLCPDCHGGRYQPATLNFRFAGRTMPELNAEPVCALADLIDDLRAKVANDPTAEMLRSEVSARLRYLVEVGLGYLTLDRPTRTLSGGEVERVNLTTCLGASLVNTLFVMDEPSIGLHPRDVKRLIRVMKNLRDKGNTLLVVEHEQAVIEQCDNVIELGPGRGEDGGELVFDGPLDLLRRSGKTLTADYLTGRKFIPVPETRRKPNGWIKIMGATAHNLRNVDVDLPLGVLGCVTGVSGSGKSTLVHDVLYRNLVSQKGESGEDEAGACRRISGAEKVGRIVMVDQSPLSKTPRSSPALYLGVFDTIREQFSMLPEALSEGLTASAFSFNSGRGRCPRCSGNGFEKIEMQFLSDIFVRCPECDGTRYQPHILRIKLRGKSIHDVLELTVSEAIEFFDELGVPKVTRPLSVLEEVGLGYLRLGQPLNVLSGGESQRLKLVAHLTAKAAGRNLLIFDEPTTGLHFDDVSMLLKAFNRLVEQGNSLLVIEHNLEVIKSADYLVDLGPEAGAEGGTVVAVGKPEDVATVDASHTGRYLRQILNVSSSNISEEAVAASLRVAEQESEYATVKLEDSSVIRVAGAREHNLKDITVSIPRDQLVVVTGISGSGKSTLAFDIVFAEGQRRFLDSMSAYARQFVEQLEKPDVDSITGLPPTVAIEQRVTRGGGKSTAATVTEVYHFLRLLFSKLGRQFCPRCDLSVESQNRGALSAQARAAVKRGTIRVLAPLVKARKGFHTDVASWAEKQGFETLLVDGEMMPSAGFRKLERFKEHSIDAVVGATGSGAKIEPLVDIALQVGKGTAKLLDPAGNIVILSAESTCPSCGQSFEELDPRLFSFNSPHGWCPVCRGFGEVWHRHKNPRAESELESELYEERQHESLDIGEAEPCTACRGSRLNTIARHVRVQGMSIDQFTELPVKAALVTVRKLKFTGSEKVIANDLLAEIEQRLHFMGTVGLDYLSLDRSARTLSGGELQRIRLAAQLGSNLSGVLYVLDEPTIGLHARDNQKLLDTLEALKAKGNSLLVVEHDEDTMRRADVIIDLGPRAGSHGGEVVGVGDLDTIRKSKRSETGRCLNHPLKHPTRGERRAIGKDTNWLEITGASANNLKNVSAKIPVGRFTVLTGISGSGKSSLMRGVLKPAVEASLKRRRKKVSQEQPWKSVKGVEFIETVYEVDQSPIGKTSRSTPATYIKVFDEIRKQFAIVPLSRMRGYSPSRFSFNTEGGRCETCLGQGVIKVEMNFLPTSYIPCSDCAGKRYNAPTLEVEYNGCSIGDVLEMTLEEAAGFFSSNPKIQRPLRLLVDTGLGYLKLGQPSPTLSGGEAQRLKLVSELTRGVTRAVNDKIRRQKQPKSTLYLLEEPTIGLHMADVEELLNVLHRLVDEGSTVIVIEHNLSLIADADHLIDIGPEAGENGGKIVVAGTPERVAKHSKSRTAPFLRKVLE